MSDPLTQAAAPSAAPQYTEQVSEFDALLTRSFQPKTDYAKAAVESAVRTLAQQALDSTRLISGDSVKAIEAIIAEIDKRLTEQLNQVMHKEEFRALEGTWRGLHHLVYNTESDEFLKIRVLNINKKVMLKDFRENPGAKWDQCKLFEKIYTSEYSQFGGEPYGCLVGDFYFDQSPTDVDLLDGMGKIAAAAHAPFIAAAAPSLLNMSSWQDLAKPRDLTKIFGSAEYAPWRSLRESENSRYLALTMPRFLARLPYGAKTNPVEHFSFEEDVEGAVHDKYVWANSAFAMATNITRAFKLYGWCTKIRGVEAGGLVEGLPCHTFPTDDGGVDMKCPTEIAIDERREGELSKAGLIGLLHRKNSDVAAFFGAQTLNKPSEYYDADATANANLSARLPYMFATCRFAHYLKSMVRDKIGNFMERADVEKFLNDWIMNYVTSDANAGDDIKARYPLAAAEVKVQEVEGNPGYYTSQFFLRPHYQLEGLTVSLRLVSKLPSVKQGG
jgi:type VI secretion system protein ImpC